MAERTASHRFLACDTLTLAELGFAHILYRHHTISIDRMAHPNLDTFSRPLTIRPAFRAHVLVPYKASRA